MRFLQLQLSMYRIRFVNMYLVELCRLVLRALCHRKTCLKVKKIKESHTLDINEGNMARHVVSPHIKSRFNDWHTTANCVVLFKITVRTPATG
jgi:hypothetical protein